MRSALWPAALITVAVASPARADLRPVVAHPERGPRVFPRRVVELGVHGGGAAAHCGFSCGDSDTFGYAAGFAVLIRPAPSYALGVVWDRAWFRWRPEGRAPLTAHVTFYRFAARLFPLRKARLDGWLECSLSLPIRGASASGVDPLPAFIGMGVGSGLDVFVWDGLKVGPSARVDWMMIGRGDAPTSGAGPVARRIETPPITAVGQIGVGITVPLGKRVE